MTIVCAKCLHHLVIENVVRHDDGREPQLWVRPCETCIKGRVQDEVERRLENQQTASAAKPGSPEALRVGRLGN